MRGAALLICVSVACEQPRTNATATATATANPTATATATATAIAKRPYWTARAQLKQPPFRVPAGVANVMVHVPEGLDAAAPLHIVLFLHGSEQCAEQLAMNGDVVCKPGAAPFAGAGLNAKHDDAGTQSIFVLPQLAYLAGGTPGRFAEKGYLRAFLGEVLGETLAPGLGAPKTLDDVASITLVAQSAGWIATSAILDHGDLDEKIRRVVLIDAFFDGGVATYARFLGRGGDRKFVSVHGAWGGNVGNARALAAKIGSTRKVAFDPPGALAQAIGDNDVVLARWDIEHSWMPLVLLTKIVSGLGLPPREVTPTRALWPGTTAGAPRPIARGEEIAATLDGSETLLANGARADDYAIALDENDRVTITVRGGKSITEWGKLDVFVQVLRDGAAIAEDDDSAGGLDARIDLRAPARATYVVRVTTAGQGARRGAYRVRVD